MRGSETLSVPPHPFRLNPQVYGRCATPTRAPRGRCSPLRLSLCNALLAGVVSSAGIARIQNREETMGRQDSRRGPIESPTERPEPRPMRRALPLRHLQICVTGGGPARLAHVAVTLLAARPFTSATMRRC